MTNISTIKSSSDLDNKELYPLSILSYFKVQILSYSDNDEEESIDTDDPESID